MSPDERFAAALRALSGALTELGAPWMIIGGVAVIAAGVPRQTIDIDAAVLGRDAELDEVLDRLRRHGIVPRIEDARAFARERQVLLLQHDSSGVTMELSFSWLPFEEEALARAAEMQIEGVRLRVARPEDLIVYKAAAWRDRDRADIERLLSLHRDAIDLSRVRELVAAIASALDDPDRVAAFDQIIERARSS